MEDSNFFFTALKEYMPLLSVLLGALIGFFASFITNWQSNKYKTESEQLSFKRNKKEELYFTVARLKSEYRGYMGACILKVTNNEPFNFKENSDIHNWEKLSMITNLYFPDLKDTVKNLLTERDEVGKVIAEVITFRPSTQDAMRELNAKVMVYFKRIDDKFSQFQKTIPGISS